MEIFRTDVRHIVLAIKSSEEKQKRCKEKLENAYRVVQNHTIPNELMKSYFTPHTKQILGELKETDEQNKSLRASLRAILMKISQQKFVNTEKTVENPIVNKERLSSENPSQISNIQRSHHADGQIHTISSKYESNTKVQEIRAHNLGNSIPTGPTTYDREITNRESLVNFKNFLTTLRKFTGYRIITRKGVG